jgi:hypothetical protein
MGCQKPTWLSEREAASYSFLAYQSMKNRRMKGLGPAYFRIGKKIAYRQSDLDQWLEQRRVQPAGAA